MAAISRGATLPVTLAVPCPPIARVGKTMAYTGESQVNSLTRPAVPSLTAVNCPTSGTASLSATRLGHSMERRIMVSGLILTITRAGLL